MWRIILLLLFAEGTKGCTCPGISINGTDQSYCWQVVSRNASTWTSADDACSSFGARLGQPDNATINGLKDYLESIYTLPIITGYVLGNAETGDVAIVCGLNEFYDIANDTTALIEGDLSDNNSCVFITDADYRLHYGACDTTAAVLCSQPEETADYCDVEPTCTSTTTTHSTSTMVSSSSGSSTSSAATSGNTTTTTVGSTTTAAPAQSTYADNNNGGGGGEPTTTEESSTECKSGGVMFVGFCVPLWLLVLTALLLIALLLFCLLCCLHYCMGIFFCCKSHEKPSKDIERGTMQTKAVQSDPEEVVVAQVIPPAIHPEPVPVPIVAQQPIMLKPEMEDKGVMTDPWAPEREQVIIYRDPKPVHYEKDDRDFLPPTPVTPRAQPPPVLEDDEMPRRFVGGPSALIVRPRRRLPSPEIRSPPPMTPLPRRPLTDEAPRKEQKKPRLEPLVFKHNAVPEEKPKSVDPPRKFPDPPPVKQNRAFPAQYQPPPAHEMMNPPTPVKASTPLPSPPPSPPLSETPTRSFPPPPSAPIEKEERPIENKRGPVQRTPVPPPHKEPAQPPPPPRSLPPPPPPSASRPARSASGEKKREPVTVDRARSVSPVRRATPPTRFPDASPVPKRNAVAPQGGSLFKSPADAQHPSNLRAAKGRLGGAAGGHGEVPSGWKAWSSNTGTFSATPHSDFD